jgi:hypothetical protein
MSTSPDHTRPDDRIVSSISQWLARHIDDAELQTELEQVGTDDLNPDGADAVEELLAELAQGAARGPLEMVAREAVEAVALGG